MRSGLTTWACTIAVAMSAAILLGADDRTPPQKRGAAAPAPASVTAPPAEEGGVSGAFTLRTTRVATGLTLPIYATAAPNDYRRLFIVEKTGRIKILNLATGALNSTPFLDINDRVIDLPAGSVSTQENFGKGIMGMAFDPDYATNGFFYLHYYKPPDAVPVTGSDGVIARYHVTSDPDIADHDSEFVVWTWDDQNNDHNGGSIDFGPDGLLYITRGDGGTQSDPENDAQNVNSTFGKILRIDVHAGDDFPVDPNRNYHIPPGNPFAAGGGAPEILHYGFRNPYRASFDTGTGNYYIGDVGQNTREEIDVVHYTASGLNFGWRCIEGTFITGLTGCLCSGAACTPAVHEYPDATMGRSVTGGYVYRGCAIPALSGQYLFADYTSNNMWRGTYNGTILTGVTSLNAQLQTTVEGFPVAKIAAFAQDARGELYMVRHSSTTSISQGEVYRIIPLTATIPPADLNCDGVVNSLDLGALLSNWSIPPTAACSFASCLPDLNGDGFVNTQDLGILLASWTL